MALTFPKVPFPGDAPETSYTISYGGKTYTFDAGLLTQRIGDWVNNTVYDRWRRYDYEQGHQMTDQEAALLGVEAETLITTKGVAEIAADDPYLADCVTKNLGTALIAILLPSLGYASFSLANVSQQLADDTAALGQAQAQLAADQAATPQDPVAIASDQALVDSLTTAVNTTGPAAVTAAQAALAAIQSQIAAIKTELP